MALASQRVADEEPSGRISLRVACILRDFTALKGMEREAEREAEGGRGRERGREAEGGRGMEREGQDRELRLVPGPVWPHGGLPTNLESTSKSLKP